MVCQLHPANLWTLRRCCKGRTVAVPCRCGAYDKSRAATAEPVTQPRNGLSSHRSMPYVVYSQNKREVTGEDVMQLLWTARESYMSTGSRLANSYFDHWQPYTGATKQRMIDKLSHSIDKSMAVVAVFTNSDVYAPYSNSTWHQDMSLPGSTGLSLQVISSPQGSSSSSSSGSSSTTWGWVKGSTRNVRRRSLIGFARAAGDASLAAAIHDVAVHPDYRGFRIGQRMLKVLVQQLYNKGIYDIGSVVPIPKINFFEHAEFEEDREQSTTLTFVGHHAWIDAEEGELAQGQLLPGPTWALVDPQHWPGQGQHTAPQGGGQAQQVADPLARIPAPATLEISVNPALHKLLRAKLDERLAAQ